MGTAINPARLKSLFRDLVNIYSPSGKEEQITEFLADYLRRAGIPVQAAPVDATRCNVLVGPVTESPDLLLLGHTDTVPAYDMEQCVFSEREGWCSGLGSADMKSGCAALIEAFHTVADQQALPPNVLLALVVGEEENGDGTAALLNDIRPREALLSEPTNLIPCLGHYGYVEMVVRAFGARRHAAMSNRETNAIRALLRFLLRIEDYIEGEDSVLNIRDLHSSESGFAVPDRCAAAVDLHVPPEISTARYADRLRELAEATLGNSAASRYEIDFPTRADGYSVSPEGALPRQLARTFTQLNRPWKQDLFRSHSDANLLHAVGCRPVVLGPGQLSRAHTVDEGIEFDQIVRAAEIFANLLAHWSAGGAPTPVS